MVIRIVTSLFLVLCGALSSINAAEPACIYEFDAIKFGKLKIHTCLLDGGSSSHKNSGASKASENNVAVDRVIQIATNISDVFIDISYFKEPIWRFGSSVYVDGRDVTKYGVHPAADDYSRPWPTLTSFRAGPGESIRFEYLISDFMVTEPEIDKRYTIAVGHLFSFRYPEESAREASINRQQEHKVAGEYPETGWFYDVRIK